MGRIEFNYLVENATNFSQVEALSRKWIFHKDIQLAIAAKVEIQDAAEFRKSLFSPICRAPKYLIGLGYHTLEFTSVVSQGGEPTIGNPTGALSPHR